MSNKMDETGKLVSVTHQRSFLPRIVTAARIGKTKANRFSGEAHRKIPEDSRLRSNRVIRPPYRFACMRATSPSKFRSLSSRSMTSSSATVSPRTSRVSPGVQIQKNSRPKSKRVIRPPFRFACMRASSPSVLKSSKSVSTKPRILPQSTRFQIRQIKKRSHPKTMTKRIIKPQYTFARMTATPPSVFNSSSSSGIYSGANSSSATSSVEFQARRRKERVWEQSDFSNLVEVGSGGYGKVYRAFAKPLDDLVALKFLELKTALDVNSKHYIDDIGLEYRLQRSVSHQNFCRVLGEFSDMTKRVLVLEFCERDLHEYIYKNVNIRIPDRQISVRLVKDLVSAVAYLHGKVGYIHMDLKPENILLTSKGVLKISDFGSVVKMITYRHVHPYDSHRGGTYSYRPYDMLLKRGFDSTADVWAIGCIAYELLMQDHPFFSYKTRGLSASEDEKIRRGLEQIQQMRDGSFQEKFTKMSLPTQAISFFNQIFGPTTNRPLVRDLEGMSWLSYNEHHTPRNRKKET